MLTLVRNQQCLLRADGWNQPVVTLSPVETPEAADKVGVEQQKRESCGTPAALADSSVQFKMLQFPPKAASKVLPAAEGQQPSAAAGSAPGLQTSSPSVLVIAKAAPSALRTKGQPHVTKAVLSQVASINQLAACRRTLMITVPRSAAPHTLAVTPQLPPSTSPQPTSLHIPPGELGVHVQSSSCAHRPIRLEDTSEVVLGSFLQE